MARAKSIISPPEGVTPAALPEAVEAAGPTARDPELAARLYPDIGTDPNVNQNAYVVDKRRGHITEAASADGKIVFQVETFWNA